MVKTLQEHVLWVHQNGREFQREADGGSEGTPRREVTRGNRCAVFPVWGRPPQYPSCNWDDCRKAGESPGL